MSWLAVDLNGTLINKDTNLPEPMAAEAMSQLLEEGHRVTIWTARFQALPEDRKQMLKEAIEQELNNNNIPFTDIWTGTYKPDADLFIGDNCVTYDGSWPWALAQAKLMLQPTEPNESDEIEE